MTMVSILMSQLAKAFGQASIALAAAFIRLIKEWQYRADIQKLRSLSDRQLSDIGLTRFFLLMAFLGDAAGRTG